MRLLQTSSFLQLSFLDLGFLCFSEVHVEQCLARVAAADAGNGVPNEGANALEEEADENILKFDDAGASKLWGGLGAQPTDEHWNLDGSTRHQLHAELTKFSNGEEHVANMGDKTQLRYSSIIQEMQTTRPMESG